MESQEKAQVNELPNTSADAVNERSTIDWPYSDLDSSVEIVKGVHAVGGTACEYDQLAAHLGLEAKGGGFRTRVTSAKTYGLLTYERGGRISLTDLGRQIIDPLNERSAKAKAFMAVPLFEKVHESFKGGPLPPQAGLERSLISFGVGSKVAKNARQVLFRSAKQAGYFELSADRLTAPPIRATEQPPEAPRDGKNGGGGNHGTGTSRQVQLKSGGTLTVSASADFFQLNVEDRRFVFELIDKLEEYEKKNEVDPLS